ncbi:MAG: efflux RND transporter periplasmic adaptor subunit [Gammaproteobacteria bacterium]|nr:efflux RND transporter periplasmic adaptor subunit [Gammaproteobacteria bacterium]MDH3363022.1 efflux RND transporter periplasmic adaptor subunit [Gammaproteobacteria bacterium]MDH3481182.1 efflux RND transporter periplasmic adaptor subunit [Gammaproteobacteria bacterium]
MADPADKISQLKIDRSTPAAAGRSWLLPGAVLATMGIILIGWMFFGAGSSAVLVETDIARKPPSAAAANSVLDASGYVVARREATVSSKVTGKVIDVFVEEGMRVEKDQVVARLDDTTQQAQLSLALAQAESSRASLQEIEAGLRNARLERDRLRNLAERKLTSQASVDAADAAYDQLAARLETGRENVKVAERNVGLARDSLANMTIKAPFAGMVVSKNAQPGEMISPISAGGGFTRTGICTIIDTDSLEIEVDVNEAYIQRVKAGQSVSATLDAYSDWRIPAEVIAIIPTADRQKATVKVRIGFLERDERILRDMGVKVAFLGTEMEAATPQEISGVMIAGEALRSDASGDFVWRVQTDVVEKRAVQVGGQRDRPQVLVVNGLSIGDIIVRSSESPLVEGQLIKTN